MNSPKKQWLRDEQLRGLRAQSREELADASVRLTEQLRLLPEFSRARNIAAYVPLPTEPNLLFLMQDPVIHRRWFFPRILGAELEFAESADLTACQQGPRGTREPEGPALADFSHLDVILIPGLAFTAHGARLGRGGGYYDRFLARVPGRVTRIGVAFDQQLVAEIPEDPHDQRLHLVVTDQRVVHAATRSNPSLPDSPESPDPDSPEKTP